MDETDDTQDSNSQDVYLIDADTDCSHDSVVQIGADGQNNQYFDCQTCSAVVIEESSLPSSERNRGEDRASRNNSHSSSRNGDSSDYNDFNSKTLITQIQSLRRDLINRLR